jgi:hypothetical protein
MHRRNLCQSPRRTRRKVHQGPRRDVASTTLVQIIIRRCFTKSWTRLDDKVRFINPINALDSFLSFGLMKPCWVFVVASRSALQSAGMPSKNSSSSLSSSKDSNVHNNEAWSIPGFSLRANSSAVSRILCEKEAGLAPRLREKKLVGSSRGNFSKSLKRRRRMPVRQEETNAKSGVE